MAIGANSYGTTAGVEALRRVYTTAGVFDASSHPTVTQVELFIDRISGIVNVLLARQGYDIPMVDADGVLALGEFVVQMAASLCDAANGSGRFFSEEMADRGPWAIITGEAEAFIVEHAQGFEDLGAARSRHLADAWMGDKPVAIAEV